MIILLDTSTPVCKLYLLDGDVHYESQWQADRALARGLLTFIRGQLSQQGWAWSDISGIGVFRGPGSFTGLRIGVTVLNTLANAEKIPIVGTDGATWKQLAMDRLRNDDNDQIVLPLYGSEAHITAARK